MALNFQLVPRSAVTPGEGRNTVYLEGSNWDDFGNKTQFYITIFDNSGNRYELGDVKIGFRGQVGGWTDEHLSSEEFQGLTEEFFSLGQDVEYYKSIYNQLPDELRDEYLSGMRDLIAFGEILRQVKDEHVFNVSLTRGFRGDTVLEQFRRVLNGDAALTKFYFRYYIEESSVYSGVNIDFDVLPNSKPPTNIHVLIGRNGIGKTTLLNNMVSSLVTKDSNNFGAFYTKPNASNTPQQINPDEFFSRVISVSFSAFDQFIPPPDQDNLEQGMRYTYIGLKQSKIRDDDSSEIVNKDHSGLCDDFISSIIGCFRLDAKKKRWETAVKLLESDSNFADMDLIERLNFNPQCDEEREQLKQVCRHLYAKKLSSGHSIVLLTITRLVEKVDEKALVILDEPESHLHPPLLSAFTRALSFLLLNRNGVALIATHSPVVLQEVPKSCVWKIRRSGLNLTSDRPEIETYGENVGVLTREIFGLEVFRSGFYSDLRGLVEDGKTFDEIIAEYRDQIGFEGKALLNSLIANVRAKNNA